MMVNNRKKQDELGSYVLYISRVAKVVQGGKRLRFRALVVVGDRNGRLGLAFAKARDPKTAVEKAVIKAKNNLVRVNLKDGTIKYPVFHKYKAAKIFFKPARKGTGLICSSSIRPILELAGVTDIVAKMYGSSNRINSAYCTYEVLCSFK